jgi:hypothetical protein
VRAATDPSSYEPKASGGITIYALSENKRPIGFAREWPELTAAKKKKRKRKRARPD